VKPSVFWRGCTINSRERRERAKAEDRCIYFSNAVIMHPSFVLLGVVFISALVLAIISFIIELEVKL
jgi:hypothetical protein